MQVFVVDEGQMGVRVEFDTGQAPTFECPGLGGWKWDYGLGVWWTRLKGERAEYAMRAVREQGSSLVDLEF